MWFLICANTKYACFVKTEEKFCLCKFSYKHGAETEMVWLFLLSLPAITAVATFMGLTSEIYH